MNAVFLVDDQALFQVGLKQLLKELEDVEVVGEASDLTSVFPQLEADPPEVAVLAISQVDDTASIREAQRRPPLPLLTPRRMNAEAKDSMPPRDTVHISLKDFRPDPDNVARNAGLVTFVLKNEGRYTHDFRVEGQGIHDRIPKVGQGRTFEWQIPWPNYGMTSRMSSPPRSWGGQQSLGSTGVGNNGERRQL